MNSNSVLQADALHLPPAKGAYHMPSAPLLTTPAELNHALSTARAAWQAAPYPSCAERRARLAALRTALQGHAGALAAAVSAAAPAFTQVVSG